LEYEGNFDSNYTYDADDIVISGNNAFVASNSDGVIQEISLGGAYLNSLTAGSTDTGTLQVDGNSTLSGDANITGALEVGGSLQATGNASLGGLTISGLITPSEPTVTPSCSSSCTSTYNYEVAAVNASGTSLASPAGSTTTAGATLSSSVYNSITWPAVSGATAYNVYRTSGGSNTGLIGTANAVSPATSTPTSFGMIGTTATITYSGGLPVNITAGSGVTLAGFTDTAINGTYTVTATTATTLQVTILGGPYTGSIIGTVSSAPYLTDTGLNASGSTPTTSTAGNLTIAGGNSLFEGDVLVKPLSSTTSSSSSGSSGNGTCNYSDFESTILANNPLTYWQLADTTSTMVDSSGNGNNGSIAGGGEDQTPGAFSCDSSVPVTYFGGVWNSDYAGDFSYSVNDPNTLTITAAFKTSSDGPIVGLYNSGSSPADDRMLYVGTDGKLYFGVAPGGSDTVINSSTTVNNGQWHFATAELSGAGMVLYLDGAEVASNPSVTTGYNATGSWLIGTDVPGETWPNFNNGFTGQIAQVATFNSVLSGGTISTLSGDILGGGGGGGSGGSCNYSDFYNTALASSPDAYWQLNDSGSNCRG
jgi:hypothetical protein